MTMTPANLALCSRQAITPPVTCSGAALTALEDAHFVAFFANS